MKLEGARGGAFQTIMFIGIEDSEVLGNLDEFHDKMQTVLTQRVRQTLGDQAGDFNISLRVYGWNGTSGRPVRPGTPPPIDVGILFVATAASQELANKIAKTCNPYFFHMPLRSGTELPSYAFPFTPAEIPRGKVFEFVLNHVVSTDDAFELVRTEWVDMAVANDKNKVMSHV
jgi:hypothetical protein